MVAGLVIVFWIMKFGFTLYSGCKFDNYHLSLSISLRPAVLIIKKKKLSSEKLETKCWLQGPTSSFTSWLYAFSRGFLYLLKGFLISTQKLRRYKNWHFSKNYSIHPDNGQYTLAPHPWLYQFLYIQSKKKTSKLDKFVPFETCEHYAQVRSSN